MPGMVLVGGTVAQEEEYGNILAGISFLVFNN